VLAQQPEDQLQKENELSTVYISRPNSWRKHIENIK